MIYTNKMILLANDAGRSRWMVSLCLVLFSLSLSLQNEIHIFGTILSDPYSRKVYGNIYTSTRFEVNEAFNGYIKESQPII